MVIDSLFRLKRICVWLWNARSYSTRSGDAAAQSEPVGDRELTDADAAMAALNSRVAAASARSRSDMVSSSGVAAAAAAARGS
jgi:hypothetical protein